LPVIEDLANDFAGRARFVRIHVDRDGHVLKRFGASGLPTYLVFRDGKEVDRLRLTFISWFLEQRLRRMVESQLDL
jgi:thioredoxin-like negative regulator of GroEL